MVPVVVAVSFTVGFQNKYPLYKGAILGFTMDLAAIIQKGGFRG